MGNRLLTSVGSFWYHSGSKSPVGFGKSEPDGIAVRSTDNTERRVGSMVFGSMSRGTRSSRPCTFSWALEASVPKASAVMVRILWDFMLWVGVGSRRVRNDVCCGSCC
jgi:hypothetical protein